MSTPSKARAEIVVDLAAIRHNVRVLGELVGDAAMMTVVKADGYGHGLVEVGRAAREAGSAWLGVAGVEEALALRAAGDRGPLLAWLLVPGDDLAAALAADVELTAYSLEQLDEIAQAAASGATPRVQLKVDTGLSRGGAPLGEWEDLVAHAATLQRDGRLEVTGIWSHLSSSDEPDDPANDAQEKLFREALDAATAAGLEPRWRHLANSAAAILRPSARFDLVRVGLATYGLDPSPGATPPLDLRPAMTLRASLALTKQVEAGSAVSYGRTWTAPHDTTLGLVPVGYADGVPRHASNRAEVLAGGSRRPVRGRVCMDQLVVDLGPGSTARPGDDVVLFGAAPAPSAQEWAEAAGTISYEIVTRLGGRLTRRHVDREQDGDDA